MGSIFRMLCLRYGGPVTTSTIAARLLELFASFYEKILLNSYKLLNHK